MNRSDLISIFAQYTGNNKKYSAYAAYSLQVIISFCLIVYAYHIFSTQRVASDTISYTKMIESGDISDWWSALYMFECRLILSILRSFFDTYTTAYSACYIICISCIIFMTFSIIYLMRGIRKRGGDILFFSVIMCSAEIIGFTPLSTSVPTIALLDAPGSMLLFSSIALTLSFNEKMSGWRRIVLLSLIFFSLLHACSFRRPFFLLLPVIALYLSRMVWLKSRPTRIIGLSFICCSAFLAGMVLLHRSLPKHKKTHPCIPMIQSDLTIASALRGDGEYMFRFAKENGCQLSEKTAVTERYSMLAASFGIVKISTEEQYASLIRDYKTYWKEHTSCMVYARMIQRLQFLTGDYVPTWVRHIVQMHSSHIPIEGVILGRYHWSEQKMIKPNYVAVMLIWLVGSILPLLLYFKTRSPDNSHGAMVLLYLSGLCFLSLACYMTVVTPTPDFRYRVQTLLIAALSIGWCCQAHKVAPKTNSKNSSL